MTTTAPEPTLRYDPIPLAEIEAARARTAGTVLRTPLIRLDVDDAPAEIYLKLECLQPIRSFKLRGAFNALAKAGPAALADGIWTTSAGNMAQGAAWAARALGVPCAVVVPETAPETKIAAARRYGAAVVPVPVAEWFETFVTRRREGMTGRFLHPFSDPDVMAGNGVIGLEFVEALPEVAAGVVPWGGGGLCCGIASALRAVRPSCRVYAAEIESGAPLGPSLAAGKPVEVPFAPSFVDGIGAPFVNPEMLDLARRLIDGALTATLAETAAALRLTLERARVVPEGAAAVPVAAALAGRAGGGKVVCILSGGNIDLGRLCEVLRTDS
jgi:threonine dehydratase